MNQKSNSSGSLHYKLCKLCKMDLPLCTIPPFSPEKHKIIEMTHIPTWNSTYIALNNKWACILASSRWKLDKHSPLWRLNFADRASPDALQGFATVGLVAGFRAPSADTLPSMYTVDLIDDQKRGPKLSACYCYSTQ